MTARTSKVERHFTRERVILNLNGECQINISLAKSIGSGTTVVIISFFHLSLNPYFSLCLYLLDQAREV